VFNIAQEDRQLRLSTLQCLGAIVEHANQAVPDALFGRTLQELSPMISDADLQACCLLKLKF
jgi:hypothetical protein